MALTLPSRDKQPRFLTSRDFKVMKSSSLPEASASLIAAFRVFLVYAITRRPDLGVIALTNQVDDEDAVRLHAGTLEVATCFAPMLEDEEALGAFLRALTEIYPLPGLSLFQGWTLLELLMHETEIATVEKQEVPTIIYPDGALWTLLSSYPAVWLGNSWCVHIGAARQTVPSPEAAIALAESHRAQNPETD